MNNVKIPLDAQLAILQQAEYNLHLFSQWVRSEHVLASEELSRLKPISSNKMNLIAKLSRSMEPSLSATAAIILAVQLLTPAELAARTYKMQQARKKLRRLQEDGLTVIAVAGSYGKTSVKHLLRHLLSTQHFCFMSPESYNTPLGIAASIEQLTDKHETFIVELGEYVPGDINELLEFVRPDVGILTPIGFAHLDRFGSQQNLIDTFGELWTSKFAPELLLVDDSNRHLLSPPENTWWYGIDRQSRASINVSNAKLKETRGQLHFADRETAFDVNLSLVGSENLVNALPGILLLEKLKQPFEPAIKALSYTPAISRRLEIIYNPNGAVVVDNSYNTNPGSWKSHFELLRSLSKAKVAIITAGFVELPPEESAKEHRLLAQELLESASIIGILRTRSNKELIENLEQNKTSQMILVGNSQAEIVTQIARQKLAYQYLWLEGGCRELYQ